MGFFGMYDSLLGVSLPHLSDSALSVSHQLNALFVLARTKTTMDRGPQGMSTAAVANRTLKNHRGPANSYLRFLPNPLPGEPEPPLLSSMSSFGCEPPFRQKAMGTGPWDVYRAFRDGKLCPAVQQFFQAGSSLNVPPCEFFTTIAAVSPLHSIFPAHKGMEG